MFCCMYGGLGGASANREGKEARREGDQSRRPDGLFQGHVGKNVDRSIMATERGLVRVSAPRHRWICGRSPTVQASAWPLTQKDRQEIGGAQVQNTLVCRTSTGSWGVGIMQTRETLPNGNTRKRAKLGKTKHRSASAWGIMARAGCDRYARLPILF